MPINFSIIVPTYNRASGISKTIESVLNQTNLNWELIIVDDGSTDNTAEVVQAFVQKDSRVRYIFQENAERSIARNNGANHANYAYLIFLDSDDFFEDNHLEQLADFIAPKEGEIAMYFTNVKVLQNNNSKIANLVLSEKYNPEYFLKNAVIPARVCLSAELLKEFQFDNDCIIAEDAVLWCEISDKHPVYAINISSVLYHLHDDNSVNITKYNAFQKRLVGLKKLFNEKPVGSRIPTIAKNEQIVNCYFGIARHHALNNRKSKAFFTIMKSLIKHPKIRLKEGILALRHILRGTDF